MDLNDNYFKVISKDHNILELVDEVSGKSCVLRDVSFKFIGYAESSLIEGGKDNVIPLILDRYIVEKNEMDISDEYISNISKIELITSWNSEVVALGAGGWLPVGLIPSNTMMLLDKNAYNRIRSRYDLGLKKDGVVDDFFDLIYEKKIQINPSLFAIEGNLRSLRMTYANIRSQYDEAVSIITKALPNSKIGVKRNDAVKSIMAILKDLHDENSKKLSLLKFMGGYLYKETSIKNRVRVINEISDCFDSFKLKKHSVLFIAILSAALSSSDNNPAKKIIKPKPVGVYSDADAYNALSDLRCIDYLMWAIGLHGNNTVVLCTNDKPLAKFWVAISANDFIFEGKTLTHTLKFRKSLFGNLRDNEFEEILKVIGF